MQNTNSLRNLFLAMAFSCLLAIVLSAGTCNRCMDNNVACVNETHFKYCVNYEPISDTLLPCGEDKICTSTLNFCAFKIPGIEPACKPADINCQSCSEDSMFVCTSRNTFRMCNGTEFTGEVLTCPTDTFCSIESGKFCVKECALPDGKYECDRD